MLQRESTGGEYGQWWGVKAERLVREGPVRRASAVKTLKGAALQTSRYSGPGMLESCPLQQC